MSIPRNTSVAPDHEPCDTCTPAFPGILIGDNTSSVGPGVVSVERCDACQVYEGDLDAAWALAKVAGGRVYFWQDAGEPEPGIVAVQRHVELGDPDEPEWERREFAGTYRDDDCIASGTDAWIEGIDLSVITPVAEQEYRVRWEIDEYASSPLEAAMQAFNAMQRPGTTATVFEVFGDGRVRWELDLQRAVQESGLKSSWLLRLHAGQLADVMAELATSSSASDREASAALDDALDRVDSAIRSLESEDNEEEEND